MSRKAEKKVEQLRNKYNKLERDAYQMMENWEMGSGVVRKSDFKQLISDTLQLHYEISEAINKMLCAAYSNVNAYNADNEDSVEDLMPFLFEIKKLNCVISNYK